MAFTFETSGNNTFLVYEIQEEDTLDTMTLGMITNNRIPGMTPVLYTQMNKDCFLKYNVTSKIAVKQFFSGVVNKRRLLGVFSSVAAVLAAAQEYMIDDNSLLLDTEYLYVDVSTCRAEVICLPLVREAGNVDSGLFFKNIMFSTQFDQTENCDYVAKIINCLNSMPVFAAEDFLCLLEELQRVEEVSDAHGRQTFRTGSMVQPASEPQAQQAVPKPQVQPQAQHRQQVASSEKQESSEAAEAGFAIPGQNSSRDSFAVPGQGSTDKVPVADEPKKAGKRQKKADGEMSILYLLQHYNKENAAAYKAQKENRKNSGKTVSDTVSASAASSSFAVPGQQARPQLQASPVKPPAQPQLQPAPIQQSATPVPQQPQAAQVQALSDEDNFGNTVVMGAEGYGEDTVVIGQTMGAAAIQPYLYRCSNKEKILLDKPVFHLGKERSYVDYCISGNATISRSHADIINRNGQFFIVDNNSTNHTYVNGEMIPSNTEIPLFHGTKIRLSDEEFEFLTV